MYNKKPLKKEKQNWQTVSKKKQQEDARERMSAKRMKVVVISREREREWEEGKSVKRKIKVADE